MLTKFWPRVIRNFLPAALIIIALGGMFYANRSSVEMDVLIDNQKDHIHAATLSINRTLLSVRRDISYLSNSLPLQKATTIANAHATDDAEQEFAKYLSAKKIYSKARWIDATGLERIRVEHNDQGTTIVPHTRHEAKVQRYYFNETMQLNSDEIYFSPLDLNVNDDVIEQPYHPVLRAAMRLFDANGQPRGICILNFDAKDLFQRINAIAATDNTEWMLLNQDGYWLRAPDAAREFGFMLPHQSSMAALHAQVWHGINASASGHFIDGSGDLWLFETVYPYRATDPLSAFPDAGSATSITSWKMVKHIDAAALSALLRTLRLAVSLTCALLLGLALFISMRLSRSQIDREQYQADLQRALSELVDQKHALEQNKQRLKEAHIHLQSILDAASEFSIIATDTQGLITSFNRGAESMLGYRAEEMIGASTPQLLHLEPEVSAYSQALSAQYGYPIEGFAVFVENSKHHPSDTREWTYVRKDGTRLTVSLTITAIKDESGKISGFLGIAHDVTELKQAEQQLRIAATAFETHEAILVTDADAHIVRVNQAFERITGYSAAEVIGKNPKILQSGRHDAEFYQKLWKTLLETDSWSGEMWDKRKDGTFYPKWLNISAVRNQAKQITHYVAIFMDMTERKLAEEEIHRLAFYDQLTSLPNRRLLLDRLEQALSLSQRNGWHGALLFLDMDKFKILNDTRGHDAGDLMLIEVANRLKSCIRDSDTVARLGGDEFVVILQDLGNKPVLAANQAETIADKIVTALSQPYLLADYEHHSSASIGVCLFKGHDTPIEELLKRADTAMYQAKSAGRNGVRFFEAAMQASVELHALIEAELRQAIVNQELQLYYQLQVDNNHSITGAEALLRWFNPGRGFIPPTLFIPLAEDCGLILPIGLWVLENAMKQLQKWAGNTRTKHLQLSVNISAVQFRHPEFVSQIQQMLKQFAIKHNLLKLELTESVVLMDVESSILKMQALQKLGVQFAMDDFGTGYSSLSYLKRLPLNQIKIDQSFVRDIVTDPNDALLVKTIIDMSNNFSLQVIAEGVETAEQLDILKNNGCNAFQGYLFGKPVPIAQFEKLVAQKSLRY